MAHSHPIIQFLSARVCASEIHTQILRWVVKHLKHIIKIVVLGKRQIDANEHENMISRTGGDVSLKNVRSCYENCYATGRQMMVWDLLVPHFRILR